MLWITVHVCDFFYPVKLDVKWSHIDKKYIPSLGTIFWCFSLELSDQLRIFNGPLDKSGKDIGPYFCFS